MSNNVAIKAENLSKAYQLGDFSTGTLSRDIERRWAILRGKEDPFLKIGETNDRAVKGNSDVVWSLQDINFEITEGAAVGVIGRNGAGKSTLLKILSRVTSPTTGQIKVRGRLASLLEVGTGFHPDLTGRENIYLNGAILGMRKQEINSRFDEILAFSGVERYVDTPVKRYSSGMYVRLAFAVAAHLQSEILIVDEVLSVGDLEFQKKCLSKMDEVSKGEGRTVLFVSHNMGMISQLCNKSIYLDKGRVLEYDDSLSVINKYLSNTKGDVIQGLSLNFASTEADESVALKTMFIQPFYENSNDFPTDAPVNVFINLEVFKPVIGLRVGFDIMHVNSGEHIFRSFHDDSYAEVKELGRGSYSLKASIPANLLNEGEYIITPAVGIHNVKWLTVNTHRVLINVINIKGINSLYSDKRPGMIAPKIEWRLTNEI